jgi:ABC-type multidrug transport system fused ATPase/permease subunit
LEHPYLHIPLIHYRDLLLKYLKPQSRRVALLAVLLLGSIALQLTSPQILRAFIDAATAGDAASHLRLMALVFLAAAFSQQALAVTATYWSERVGWTATNALRADVALHCLQLDLSFHKKRTPGELIERIDGDVTALANFFSQFVVQVVGNALLLVGVLLALWFMNWRAGLVMTIFAIGVLAGLLWARGIAVPHWTAFRQASAELFGFIEERLAGTEDIRSSGGAPYVMRRLYSYTRERIRRGRRARLIGSLQWGLPILLFALGTGAAFVVIVLLYSRGSMTLGTAFLIYAYTLLSFQPMRAITNQMDDFQKASAGIVRIHELLQIKSILPDVDPAAARCLPSGPLSVEYRDVAFGYGDDDMVVHDLNFALAPGEVLGLLGRTGSGKTTITRLLFRLYDPAAGAILLGGVDVRTATRAEVRDRIGLVTQDVQLFRGTVRDNITFFDHRIDDAHILRALDDLGLAEWCRALPSGLDTMLGGGGGLSAGEAQLLAFTRVFLKDPGLVILDEASSRLDPATERLIERAIDRLVRNRTGIIIAHRLGTVRRADRIMILEYGRIREHGDRIALAADPTSRFSQLLAAGIELASEQDRVRAGSATPSSEPFRAPIPESAR